MSKVKTVRIKMLKDLDIGSKYLKAGDVLEAIYVEAYGAYQLYENSKPTDRCLIQSDTLFTEVRKAA